MLLLIAFAVNAAPLGRNGHALAGLNSSSSIELSLANVTSLPDTTDGASNLFARAPSPSKEKLLDESLRVHVDVGRDLLEAIHGDIDEANRAMTAYFDAEDIETGQKYQRTESINAQKSWSFLDEDDSNTAEGHAIIEKVAPVLSALVVNEHIPTQRFGPPRLRTRAPSSKLWGNGPNRLIRAREDRPYGSRSSPGMV